MNQTSPELIAAATEPLVDVYRAAAKLLHERRTSVVRRFQRDTAPYIGEFNAGELGMYAAHAGSAAVRSESRVLDVLGGWLRVGGGSSAPVTRIDIRRSPLNEPGHAQTRARYTETRVTFSSPTFGTPADGRYGLQVMVKTREGEPYQGSVSPVYAHTHKPGQPAVEDAVSQTPFYLDAPAHMRDGRQMEASTAAGFAAVTLLGTAATLMNGVQEVPGVESLRLHAPSLARPPR